MKYALNIFFLLIISTAAFSASDIASYMSTYRNNQLSDVALERELLTETTMQNLLKDLAPFYADTLDFMRRKAYYLTYKKALTESYQNQAFAINQLVKGCSDISSVIINQNIDYLKQFTKEAFDKQAQKELELLLPQPKYEAFSDIYLLAGYIGIGYEDMNRLNLKPETSKKFKWTLQLALARMGNSEALQSIMKMAKQMEAGDDVVAYLLPHLVYTRQKQALDYCIQILNDQDKNCSPPNAESSKKIVCGYRIMELLAPVIVNFPLETDATGMVVSDDYTSALEQARNWFKANPNYSIKNDRY